MKKFRKIPHNPLDDFAGEIIFASSIRLGYLNLRSI
jgi:hypothetical protein